MGKPTGFLEWQRELPGNKDPKERVGDYREFQLPLAPEKAREQGGRCMNCGIPFCHQGCPLGNLIPDWNDLVYRDKWQRAFVSLSSTNNFPEFTGRLCPAPCEAACTLAVNTDPVTIEQMEREIIERAFAEGWVQARPPQSRTGFRVAVVGSGPAGLAAAAQLNRAGHLVTVFERDDRIGGLLRYGIPDFKMEKWVIDRRLKILEAEGVIFRTGVDVGRDPTWTELRNTHEAVIIATGARRPRELEVPGRELDGVHLAMDFLTQQNREVAGDTLPPDRLTAKGKNVVVLGGGDTGADCVGTSHRQGAKSVTQIELMPMPPESRPDGNPWPQWPMVLRTSTSHEEGGVREFAVMTKKLTGADGKLEKLHAVRIDLQRQPNGTTRIVEQPDSEFTLDVDLLILAMGFVGPETEALASQLGVELDARGNVKANEKCRTSVDGVYAVGDAKRGASLIVWAIAEGREAARAADEWLTRGRSVLPTRGADFAFGGR